MPSFSGTLKCCIKSAIFWIKQSICLQSGSCHPASNMATEVTNNKFYFWKMEVRMWMLQWEHSGSQRNLRLCSPFSVCFVDKKVSTQKCHDFPPPPFAFSACKHRQRRRTQERKAHGWSAHSPVGYLLQVVKIPMFCEGMILSRSEALTGEATRRFIFAVKNIFITTLSHQLHFPSFSDVADRSQMSIIPPRNELYSLT